jgi:hypothetical protein
MDTEMNIVLNQFLACTPVYEISWILFDPDPTYQNLLFNKVYCSFCDFELISTLSDF